jgi:hypothetical protein
MSQVVNLTGERESGQHILIRRSTDNQLYHYVVYEGKVNVKQKTVLCQIISSLYFAVAPLSHSNTLDRTSSKQPAAAADSSGTLCRTHHGTPVFAMFSIAW